MENQLRATPGLYQDRGMAWEITDDVEAFLAAAGTYLAADPVRNTVLLTAAAAVRQQGPHAYGGDAPPQFGWWQEAEARR
ncbi:hypothetical protein GXW82_06010 [Streptacidiphilus sp. 4-A2]|nr:hypothetical protein [Streptacidiphilus sp. 4-A2]